MNQKIFFACLLVFVFGLGFGAKANAATYYVSPTGSNTSPYDTWAKAANLPATAITAGNTDVGGDGPHVTYIAPGTYDSYLTITDTDWADGTIIGTAAHELTADAAKGQVILNRATQHSLRVSASGITVKNLTLTGTDATHDTIYLDGSNFTGDNLYAYDSGRYLLQVTSSPTNFLFSQSLFSGSNTTNGIQTGSGSGAFRYCTITNSGNYLSGSSAAYKNINAIVNIDNSIIQGAKRNAINQNGTGTVTVSNSILMSGDNSVTSGATVFQESGTITVDHSVVIANWDNMWSLGNGSYFNGTVGDTNNIKTNNPKYVRHSRSGFIVPCVDDSQNSPYAASVLEPLLAARDLKGTQYAQSSGEMATNLATLLGLQSRGVMEVQAHTFSHSDLSLSGNIFSITKAGATINVDRAANQIVITPGGTIAEFKNKTLATIKAELEGYGSIVGPLPENLYNITLGEIMADSSGAQASPYTPQILIDTTAATGFFKVEMTDARTAFQSQMGYFPSHLATPGGASDANLEAAAKAAGFLSSRRSFDTSNSSWILNSINIYKLPILDPGFLWALPKRILLERFER